MRPVFNLTVEDAHCYFANGVLTHNCDTTTQAWRYFADRWMTQSDAKSDEPAAPAREAVPQPGDREYSSEDGGARWSEEERSSYG